LLPRKWPVTDFWRIVHIFSGVVWVGGSVVLTLFVAPTAQKVGDPARPFMQALLRTNMTRTLLGAGVATVVSGLYLYFDRFGQVVFSGRSGVWLTIGGLAGVTALAVGYTFGVRSSFRMRALAAEIAGGGPPAQDQIQEIERLQRRLTRVGPPLLTLLAIALLGMVLGG
jgi:uncharacterized membrane protein